MNKPEYKSKDGRKWTPVAVAVVGAFLGSSGTIAVYLGTPAGQEITRPDPYTGTEGAALEHRVNDVEAELNGHLGAHPDEMNHFDRRITTLEVQYSQILANQQRILNRLEAL